MSRIVRAACVVVGLSGCSVDTARETLATRPDAAIGSVDAATAREDVDASVVDASTASAPDWLPWPAADRFQGRSLTEWVTRWAAWHLSIDDCAENPYFDVVGSACAMHQEDAGGTVFFLATGEYPTRRTQCRIPHGTAILVPLVYFLADGRVLGVNGVPPPNDHHAHAEQIFATMRDLHLSIDRLDVSDLTSWRVGPTRLDLEIHPAPNIYNCPGYEPFEGRLMAAIAGAFVLLPAPERGEHELRYGGTFSEDGFEIVNDVTTTFQVE